MWCPQQPIRLQGNFEAPKASTYAFFLSRCDPKKQEKCATDEEFKKWIAGKYMVVLENSFTFNQNNFDKKLRVIEESKMRWLPISADIKIEDSFYFDVKEVEFYDDFF